MVAGLALGCVLGVFSVWELPILILHGVGIICGFVLWVRVCGWGLVLVA